MAKTNVEKYYSVVGILENMVETLQVLESHVPAYFEGALQVYYEKMSKKINHNVHKPNVSNDTKDLLKANMTLEFEFYNFCRQKLFRQSIAISQKGIL